jgi:pimeloyl-ACP methyl ester carboxylesterase
MPAPSVLLVHGAIQGPWYWDRFAGRLRQFGHDVHTVRLRGHDQRPGRLWYRVRDYVEDVSAAVAEFDTPPVLVGHSMGGLLVERVIARQAVPGAVLLAAVPPGGLLPAMLRIGRRHPLVVLKVNATLSLRPLVASAELARELFFTAATPTDVVEGYRPRRQGESYLAFLDLLRPRPSPNRFGVPVLVLGAELDGVVTVDEVREPPRVRWRLSTLRRWELCQRRGSTRMRSVSGPCGWCLRSGRSPGSSWGRSPGWRTSWGSTGRPCAVGSSRRRSTAAGVRVFRRRTRGVSPSWSGRTGNCGVPTRF